MSHNVKNNNDFRTVIYVKSGHNHSHNRVITLSELCISYKDLCINLHTRNNKKHKRKKNDMGVFGADASGGGRHGMWGSGGVGGDVADLEGLGKYDFRRTFGDCLGKRDFR